MAREEIRVDIVADDEASKVIGKVADKAEQLEKVDPEVTVTADDEATRKIEGLESDLRRLEDLIVELQIKVDTSQAEAGLNRVKTAGDDIGGGIRRGADDASDGMRRIGDEADQSGSVMANMAGNASQDIGELAGVTGTAGVAIGQLAEYATEGNISLSNLVKIAGPMLALGVATKVVSDHMAKVKAADAFSAKQVQTWVDAMKEGATLTEAIAESWQDAGKVEVEVGNDIVNLNGVLAETNTTAEQFNELQQKSTAEIDAWGAAMRAAGADATATNLVVVAAKSQHDDLADAEKLSAVNAEVFGDAVEVQSGKVKDHVDALNAQKDAINEVVDAQRAAADSTFAALEASEDVTDATNATTGALWTLIAAQQAYNAEPTAENAFAVTAANEALTDSVHAERRAIIDAADATQRMAEDQARANGQTLTAEQRTDAFNTSLLDQAHNATPQARAELAAYLVELYGIPPEKATEIVANADTQEARDDLDEFAGQRRTTTVTVSLEAAVAARKLNELFQQAGGRSAGMPPAPSFGPRPTPYTQNITVNLPRGTRPSDMIRAVENYSRRNGRLAGRR